jgi:hypothetical protein
MRRLWRLIQNWRKRQRLRKAGKGHLVEYIKDEGLTGEPWSWREVRLERYRRGLQSDLQAALVWLLLVMLLLIAISASSAHERWANGDPVPLWVKMACCGPEDAHHLEPWQVHTLPDGWHIDGYPQVIAYGQELRSFDGEYWLFYRDEGNVGRAAAVAGMSTPVPLVFFCFFAPEQVQ